MYAAVSDWSVDDVSDWLEHELKYPQYASAFVDNEMNGAVLMDISLEDLDYLNITKLAHRKMILKSVEALRVNPNPKNQGPKKLQNLPKVPPKSSLSAMDNAIGTESVDPQPNHTVHWSHLQPLSNNEVTNEAMPPNAADGGVNSYSKGGPEDTLDEEAEQAAFREAVMAWRASGTKNTVGGVNVDAGTSSSGSIATPGAISAGVSNIISQSQSTTSADGGWSDPFANPQYDDAANAYLYSDAPDQEQERERAAHTAIVKTSANSTDSNGITVIATKGGTQILHQPMTDEEEAKERAEFKKAVMQWRVDNGKATKEDLAELKLAEKGVVGEAVGTGTEMVKNDIAARLSKQLDSQYQANAKLLDKQRKLAEDKLAQVWKDRKDRCYELLYMEYLVSVGVARTRTNEKNEGRCCQANSYG